MADPIARIATPPMVVLVDEDDRPVGVVDKLAAHQPPGLRHRALSAFVFDERGGIILQRRATTKYHFPGLWSNSCCTHPGPGESVVAAGERRVVEELGIRCRLQDVGVFTYRAEDPVNGLVEHEVDHVLVGRSSDAPVPDPTEVDDVMVLDLLELDQAVHEDPKRFTPWLAGAIALLRRSAVPEWPVDGATDTDEVDSS